jgi:hypothetical protein
VGVENVSTGGIPIFANVTELEREEGLRLVVDAPI